MTAHSHLRAVLRAAFAALAMAVSFAGTAADRPKVGLVLGGGGARGAAHIGVLEALEQLRIPVDCVAGTSLGALVAGAWAAGLDPATLRKKMGEADWNDMFQDNPGYVDINYRNKRLARRYLSGSEVGISDRGIETPPGLLSGQKIKLFFNQLVGSEYGERQLEDLPLPVSMVATDIATGERVVYRQGSLTSAMRASMSVPGLMAPLEYQGRKLVDGGLVDNLPVQEVRDLCGAEIVIAVNVGTPPLKASEISGFLSVSAQMVGILTQQNVTKSLAQLTPNDIYIQPDLLGLTAASFDRSGQAADRGRAATEKMDRLASLSVDRASYDTWRQRWLSAARKMPVVDAIEITGLRHVHPAAITRHLEQQVGEPLNVPLLQTDLLRTFGDGYYESVDYRLTRKDDHTVLTVVPVEKAWGPDYARLGLNVNASLTGRQSYSVRAAYQRTWINALGGELQYSGELGSTTGLGIDYYQPLDAQQRFFAEATAGVRRENLSLFVNDLRVADYRNTVTRVDLSAGANLGLAGQARLGWREEQQRLDIETGQPLVTGGNLESRGPLLSFDLDRRDQLHVSANGWSAKASWFESIRGDYNKASMTLDGTTQLNAWVVGLRGTYSGSTYGVMPPQDMGRLGGFMNLSGFATDQLMGDKVSYAHIRAERIFGRMPLGVRGDLRIGVALEAGQIGVPLTEPQRTGMLNSVLIYGRAETPFGPAYVGLGHASTGQVNAYFFVGTP